MIEQKKRKKQKKCPAQFLSGSGSFFLGRAWPIYVVFGRLERPGLKLAESFDGKTAARIKISWVWRPEA